MKYLFGRAFGRPVTPTDCLSSECMSSSGESEIENGLPPSVPTRRDPALLVERLENSKKKIGRAKRRRAANGEFFETFKLSCNHS